MAEILDLVAKVSWDTNSEELKALNQQMKVQDKALEELRLKGRRLEEQLVKTNDPKKVKLYNEQLQAVKRSADAITEAQKKQATATETLKQKQKQLHDELRKNNDPKMVQGLLRGLHTVENQMDALTSKATTFGSKFSGVTSLIGGLGIGFGASQLIGAISSFFSSALNEAGEAEQGLLRFKQTLDNIGQGGLFDKLVTQADKLAGAYGNLFDNDDILAGQAKFIEGTKVSEAQLQKLISIAIELAAKLGTDVVTASEMLVNSIIGRTSPELKRLGLDMKGLGTDTERVNKITGDFADLLSGSVNTALQTSQGQAKRLRQEIANLEEDLGTKLLPLEKALIKIKLALVNVLNEALSTPEDKENKAIEDRADSFLNVLKIKGQKITNEQLDATIEKRSKEVDFIKKIIAGNEQIIESHKSVKETMEAERRLAKAKVELIEREGQLMALQQFKQSKIVGDKALNPNAGQDEETEKKKVQTTKKTAEQKKKVEEEYYNDVTNLDKEYQKMLDDASKQAIERVQNANEKKYENNKKYKQMELDLIKENLNAELPDDVAEQKEKSRLAREELYNQVLNTADTAQEVINIEQRKTDRLISLQEERVNSARENSAVSLKIEQERLDALLEKRRKYERAQRVIDAGVIVANQAVAISGAIRQIATATSIFQIGANVLAIGAGITASVLAVRNAFADDGFKEGGYTGDGDPNQESTAIGKRPYKYHKKEFVMDEELTSKHRDMFEGIHKRDLVVQKMDDGRYYIAPNTDRLVSDYYASKSDSTLQPLLSEVAQMRKILAQREVNITNTFDADGFGQSVATQLGIAELKRMRR